MIVLISPEKNHPNEFEILPQLFEAGLTHFHLRKPHMLEVELMAYISRIDEKYYPYIVLHHYHNLTKRFELKGVHFQEQFRIDLAENLLNIVECWQSEGFTVSSSFHDPEVIKSCEVLFDYHFLSPIFESISKPGYMGRGFEVHDIDKTVIGMGGVRADNLQQIQKKGYKGAGVLGGVWNSEDPVSSFKKLVQQSTF